MKRSGGVTAAAIVLIALSAVTLAIAPISVSPVRSSFGAGPALFSLIYLGALATWGLVTGIGLLRLAQWARASVLLICGFGFLWIVSQTLLDVSLAMAPLRPGPDGEIARRVFLSTIPISFLELSLFVWWFVLFLLSCVKRQFEPSDAMHRPVPLSLALVGVGLIVLVPLTQGMSLAMPMRLPRSVFGYLIRGLAGPIYDILLILLAIVIGFGVLSKSRWGLAGAVAFSLFAVFERAYRLLWIDSHFVRFVMREHLSFWQATRELSDLVTRGVIGLALPAIALWILWSRRGEFAGPTVAAEAAAGTDGGRA